jgi:hypothetical protein
MFKKIIFSLSFAISCFNVNACSVNYNTATDEVQKSFHGHDGWTFKNYDAICEKLARANAKLLISGHATVLGGRSIAWVDVSLSDMKLPITTNSFGRLNTEINENASMDTAYAMLFESLNSAIEVMQFDNAINSLNEARQKVKAFYGRNTK